MYPLLEKLISVKVKCLITLEIEPRLEITAMTTANNINGMYKFLVSFNLIL